MILRDYQKIIVNKGIPVLKKYKFLYLAMEVRTGKTATSLTMSSLLNVSNLLFITKKKAIPSIVDDYNLLNLSFSMEAINYESLHKLSHETHWDMIICDEAHCLGAFPKKSKRANQVRQLIISNQPYVILLSGTPTPESYSQMYHQVFGIAHNPFNHYKNFYQFARKYVDVKQIKIHGHFINDYSRGRISILEEMKPFTISYTQKEAGFKVHTDEEILYVDMCSKTYDLVKRLSKDLVIEGKEETLLADTAVKLMSKTHQLYSGTVKFESGKSKVLDFSKVHFIKEYFKDKKIAIFYKFRAEFDALKEVYEDKLCDNLEDFNSPGTNIALQIVSGREGISLAQAEALIYYNIDFSATSYWQSRDRMTTKNRKYNKIYWIFARKGIENKIYKTVVKKKDYTLNHFKKDLLTL
jgi:hypothetical protein